MIEIRNAAERGHAHHGWLQSFHSFSFADYFDPKHMGYGNLRVINEDRIAPGTGFGRHSHRDMEIVSYVLAGALAHRDSMGNGEDGSVNGGVILPGDVQRMTAGTGVSHSEFNHSQDEVTHFLQIWLLPSRTGLTPEYEQKHFPASEKRGRLRLVAAPDGREGAVSLHADAQIWVGLFHGGESDELQLRPGRLGYVHVVRGEVDVNGISLSAGDALKLRHESRITISGGRSAEVMAFDLAP